MMTTRTWPRLAVSLLFATALASCGGGGGDGGVQQTHLGIESYSTPQVVPAGLTFVTLESSEQHVCGTVSDGSLWCWGSNAHGELATGAVMEPCSTGPCTGTPQQSATSLRFVALASSQGNGSTCGLVASGDAYCWGGIANPGGPPTTQPSPVAGGLKFGKLRLNLNGVGACGLTQGGVMYCWGALGLIYGNGQKFEIQATPTAVRTTLTFTDFDLAEFHACGVAAGGQTYCWGDNWYGQLGQGSAGGAKNGGLDQSATPLVVPGIPAAAAVVTGSSVSCALATDGAAYCWGSGQATGVPTTAPYGGTPTAVQGDLRFTALAAGYRDVCGLTLAGAAYCWGDNSVGELGNGTLIDSQVPVKVSSPVPLKGLSHRGACGIGTDSLGYCWGYNVFGEVARPPYDAPAHP